MKLRALVLASLVCSILFPASTAVAAEFDRTFAVTKGTSLDLRLFGGTIVVQAWDKDEVRVRASHFATDEVSVQPAGHSLTVRARARVGSPHAIDFRIDVPSWMPLKLAGTYLDVTVNGTRADVNAQTVRGDVKVTGGTGAITLKSIEGQVVVEGADGRMDLTSTSNGVRISHVRGSLVAQTVSGQVKVEDADCSEATVSTTSGDLTWNGPLKAGGRYAFATFSGDVDVSLPAPDNVAISVRVFDGLFRSTLPAKVPDQKTTGKPFQFVLGNGGAALSLETFSGTISLRRLGT